ncbi:MAG: hypothetical protein AAGA06_11610 [Pseudomonadota bacterium]
MRTALPLSLVFTAVFAPHALADVKAANTRAKAGDFDASMEIACAQEVGETLNPCKASVARVDAAAVVVVTFPNGFKRVLMFDEGAFLRGNTTMSGVGTDTDWTLSDGLYRVRVDDQQFEIPEALISPD